MWPVLTKRTLSRWDLSELQAKEPRDNHHVLLHLTALLLLIRTSISFKIQTWFEFPITAQFMLFLTALVAYLNSDDDTDFRSLSWDRVTTQVGSLHSSYCIGAFECCNTQTFAALARLRNHSWTITILRMQLTGGFLNELKQRFVDCSAQIRVSIICISVRQCSMSKRHLSTLEWPSAIPPCPGSGLGNFPFWPPSISAPFPSERPGVSSSGSSLAPPWCKLLAYSWRCSLLVDCIPKYNCFNDNEVFT